MSVDNWFDYWITNIICNRSPNCIRNYTERYKRNVQPVIGTMCMGDVKPMHCQIILNRMESTYAGSTIRQTYIAMGTMFKSAVMNDIIVKHPMNGVRYNKPVRACGLLHCLYLRRAAGPAHRKQLGPAVHKSRGWTIYFSGAFTGHPSAPNRSSVLFCAGSFARIHGHAGRCHSG